MVSAESKRVTLKDVAKEANVSIVTVSRVVNQTGEVNSKTRDRVLEIAREMGYLEYARNRSINRGSIGSNQQHLDILLARDALMDVPEAALNSFRDHIIGIEQYLSKQNARLMVHFVQHSSSLNGHLEQSMQRGQHGVIIDSYLTQLVDYTIHRHIPSVVIRSVGESYSDKRTTIFSDNFLGTVNAIHYLHEKGHRDIAFLGSSRGAYFIRSRVDGYVAGLWRAGITPREENIICVESNVFAIGREEVFQAMDRAWALSPRPTAVFDASGYMASHVLEWCSNRGVSCPGELSLMGFYEADHMLPERLTHIRQDFVKRGAIGARELLNAIRDPHYQPCGITAPSELVERASVSPPLS